ncbi:organic hydroperoxide resistance protein [Bradyrhizobium yuanmingense]|uniref:organic hydroperoxide resistance protein n=1 Tax=Bradyrhizobium yuanmingense TaxID=108015 RepID=UPI0023B9EA87|nr:organic hydroperoxide resistance protein [Bradyrhizobium yuanmingense]MDF0520140.1 organic hydroperoxide resistance protein [Bradyrhizobium yuanmingense]
MEALYTATATAVGGRAGSVKSSDGVLDLQLAYPKELGGPGGVATNPEQLFAAGYAACFENALMRVARERKVPIRESSVTAHVAIGKNGEGFFELAVVLEISVPNRDRAEIQEMIRVTHEEVCPYSRATRGNIEVEFRIT